MRGIVEALAAAAQVGVGGLAIPTYVRSAPHTLLIIIATEITKRE
jgi:hypothetical protein